MTRRNFATLANREAWRLLVFAAIDSKFNGVMIGAQTYSFRTLPSLDDCVAAMKEIGLGYAELWDNQILPKDRSQIAAWRSNPPMDEIRGIRKKFDDAGIDLYAFNYSFRDEFTDAADRAGLSDGQGHGRHSHHGFSECGYFAARRQIRRAVQDLRRLSRSRQHEAERVFDARTIGSRRWPAVRNTRASISISGISRPRASIR